MAARLLIENALQDSAPLSESQRPRAAQHRGAAVPRYSGREGNGPLVDGADDAYRLTLTRADGYGAGRLSRRAEVSQ